MKKKKINLLTTAVITACLATGISSVAYAEETTNVGTLDRLKTQEKTYLSGEHPVYELATEKGEHTQNIKINGTDYYFTPNDGDTTIVNLVNTGTNALKTTPTSDGAVFKQGETYYTYDSDKLPVSSYNIVEVIDGSSNYTYSKKIGDTTHFYRIEMKPAADGKAYTYSNDGTEDNNTFVIPAEDGGTSQYYNVGINTDNLSTSDKIDWATTPYGKESYEKGSVNINLPNATNPTTIYYQYTKPSDYTETGTGITNITADNVNKKVFKNITSSGNGGAISNTSDKSTINIISDFIENSSSSEYEEAYGGAIYNTGTLGNISGDFIGNSSNASEYEEAYGGAIFNYDGTIGNISGDFIGNYSNTSEYEASGGAIFNEFATLGNISGDFIGNSSSGFFCDGGAIYNWGGTIGDITGDFIGNYANSSGEYAYGGAISNYLSAKIGDITGDFIGNYSSSASAYGGAIANYNGTIGNISGDFLGNYVNSSGYEAYGGAIFNNSTSQIDNITGDFSGNYASASGSTAYGGAIFNESSTIGNISSDFIGNYVNSSNSTAYGGAIFNSNGTLGNISGDFIGNFANSSSSDAGGGAIFNNSTSQIDNITGDFSGNYVHAKSSAYGGAILNADSTISDITGDFSGNSASGSSYACGGAIYNGTSAKTGDISGNFNGNSTNSSSSSACGGAVFNYSDSTIGDITGNFSENFVSGSSSAYGGAIYNDSSATIGDITGDFINNFAKTISGTAQGGAIWTSNNLSFVANGRTNTFSGNYTQRGEEGSEITDKNAIWVSSNSAKLTFTSTNNGKFIMNDNINGTPGYDIAITGDNTGSFELNNQLINANITLDNITLVVSGENPFKNSTLTANSGTYKLAKDTSLQNINNLTLNGTTLDLQNNHAGDVINITTLSGNGDKSNLKLDFDASTGDMDKFSISTVSSTPHLFINHINVLADGNIDTATYLTGNAAELSKLTLRDTPYTSTATSGGYIYTFNPTSTAGVLQVVKDKITSDPLKIALLDPTVDSFSLVDNHTVISQLYPLAGENRNFTIYGNNFTLDGNGWHNTGTDVNIDKGQTLNIDNITVTNFSTPIDNNGTTNLNNTAFTSNLNKDITNAGTLNLSGNNTFNGGIENSGRINILENSNVVLSCTVNGDGTTSIAKNASADFSEGGTISNTQHIIISNNSSLNLLNNLIENISDISITDGGTAHIDMDFSDTFNTDDASSVNGTIHINSVNMKDVIAGTSSIMTTTLGNNLLFADTNFVNTNKVKSVGFNADKVNPNQITMTALADNLDGAIQQSASNDAVVYIMNSDENISSDSDINSKEFVIKGDGHNINNGSIIVEKNASLYTTDTNFKNSKTNENEGYLGAITVKGNATLDLVAKDHDVTIINTDNKVALALTGDATNISTVNFTAENGKTIKINDDIFSDNKSNIVNFNGGTIEMNGLFDPATANVESGTLIRNGYDDDISYNLKGGTLKYEKDNYLYEMSMHGNGKTFALNSIDFQGGALDLRNYVTSAISLKQLNISSDSNLYLDVDLKNKTMDKFNADTPINVKNGAHLNVDGLNLISDAEFNIHTSVNFTKDDKLKKATKYTGKQGIAYSSIYKYDVNYDSSSGNFNFTRNGSQPYNPALFAAPVAAQIGGYLNQLNSYDEAFHNLDMIMLLPQKERDALKFATNCNCNNTAGSLIKYNRPELPHNQGVWFKPYATFESVGLNGGPDVRNNAYGGLIGADNNIISYKKGWDAVYSLYTGYNGSNQDFDSVNMWQNGGLLGATAVFYKGKFFTGLTANVGAGIIDASTRYGTDHFTMLNTGGASKTGYNFEFLNGKFIVQPSLQLAYAFVNTFDYTNRAGVEISSDPLNALQIQPGLKFIGNLKNGWQPYAGISFIWNCLDKTKYMANDVSLPDLSVDPYVQYGVGIKKRWGEKCTGAFDVVIRNGGRNGVALTAGFKYDLGKKANNIANGDIHKLSERTINIAITK